MSFVRNTFLVFLLISFPGISWAATGKIAGTVTNASTGVAISGANVVASQSNVTKGSTTTAANGSYTLTLTTGTYTVTASAVNCTTGTKTGIVVTTNKTTNTNFALSPIADTMAPTVPTELRVSSVSLVTIDLVWTASTDNVGVIAYSVYRNGVGIGTSTTTLYHDIALTSGTSYTYTIDAYDAAGNHSAITSPVIGTTLTPDTQSPTIPSGLAISAVTLTTIDLSWVASTDNIGVTGYTVYRDGSQVGTSISTSYADSGLASGTSHSYTIDAYDASGNHSNQCVSIEGRTLDPDTLPPTKPINLSATVIDGSSVRLSWSPSTDNVGVATYWIFRNCDNLQGTSVVTTTDITELVPQSTYYFSVKAVDSAGNFSESSNIVQVTTIAATPPLTSPKLMPAETYTRQSAANLTYKTKNDSGSTILNYYANIYFPVGTSLSVINTSPAANSVTTYSDHISCLWTRINNGVEIVANLTATNTSYYDATNIFECQAQYTLSKQNYASQRNHARIAYDTQKPELIRVSPAYLLTNQSIANHAGWIEPLSVLTVKVNTFQQYSGRSDCSGSFSVPISLTEGDNLVEISAVDRAGNFADSTNTMGIQRSIYKDTQPPYEPSVSLPATVTTSLTSDVTVYTDTMNTVEIYVNNIHKGTSVQAGTTTFSNVALINGDNSIKARAIDRAGNIGNYSPTEVVSVDNTPPVITISNEGVLTRSTVPGAWGYVQDAHPQYFYENIYSNYYYYDFEVFVNGSYVGLRRIQVTTPIPSATLFSINMSSECPSLPQGANEIKLRVADAVGNIGESVFHLTVDSLPPPAPIVNIPSLTSNRWQVVAGTTDPACTVDMTYGELGVVGQSTHVVSDSVGRFVMPPIELKETIRYEGGTFGYNSFTLHATDAAGNVSGNTSIGVRLDTTAPVKPGKPIFMGGNSERVDLLWQSSSSIDAVGYILYRSTVSGSLYTRINSTPINEHQYSDAFPFGDIRYYYCVAALDLAGNESPCSEETMVYPGDTTPAQPPIGVEARGGNGSTYVKWAANVEQDLTEYRIYRRTDSGAQFSIIGKVNQQKVKYIDNMVTNGVSYFYVVTAVDKIGHESAFSAEASATPLASGPSFLGGDISHYTKLTVARSPYLAVDDISVGKPGGEMAKLEIEPGVTVQFLSGLGLQVKDGGVVIAVGNAQNPIVFTSGEPSVAAGDWAGIKLANGSFGKYSQLTYCTIEYAGGIKDTDASVSVTSSSPLLENLIVRNNRGRGIYFNGSKGTLRNSIISQGLYVEDVGINSNYSDIVQIDVSTPILTGNTFTNYAQGGIHIGANALGSLLATNSFQGSSAQSVLEVVAENISQDATWLNIGIPIHMMHNPDRGSLYSSMYIAGQTNYVTLNIEAGVEIQFESKVPGTGSYDYAQGGLSVTRTGVLNINGSATNPVVFRPDDDTTGRLRGIYIYHLANGTPQSMIHGLVIEKCLGYYRVKQRLEFTVG